MGQHRLLSSLFHTDYIGSVSLQSTWFLSGRIPSFVMNCAFWEERRTFAGKGTQVLFVVIYFRNLPVV